jgi:hypothetical protein
MARTPRAQTASANPSLAALQTRYAAARRAADEAAARVAEASTRELNALLRAKPDARFAALADPASVLTPEDRARLLASLRGQSAPARAISAATASRWAIWRSRLPYRVVPLTLRGTGAVGLIGLGLLAWQRTPEVWVTPVGRQALPTSWRLPDGGRSDGTLNPGQRYALMRWQGATGVVRLWLPGRGYAETGIERIYLQDSR